MRFALIFPFPWIPRSCQSNECLLAINWRNQNAGAIPILSPVRILRHHERPFALVASFPGQSKASEIKGNIQAADQSAISFDCRPEYSPHELRAGVQRKLRWEGRYILNCSSLIAFEGFKISCWEVVGIEDAFLCESVFAIYEVAKAIHAEGQGLIGGNARLGIKYERLLWPLGIVLFSGSALAFLLVVRSDSVGAEKDVVQWWHSLWSRIILHLPPQRAIGHQGTTDKHILLAVRALAVLQHHLYSACRFLSFVV